MIPGKEVLVTGKTFVDSGPSLRRLSCICNITGKR